LKITNEHFKRFINKKRRRKTISLVLLLVIFILSLPLISPRTWDLIYSKIDPFCGDLKFSQRESFYERFNVYRTNNQKAIPTELREFLHLAATDSINLIIYKGWIEFLTFNSNYNIMLYEEGYRDGYFTGKIKPKGKRSEKAIQFTYNQMIFTIMSNKSDNSTLDAIINIETHHRIDKSRPDSIRVDLPIIKRKQGEDKIQKYFNLGGDWIVTIEPVIKELENNQIQYTDIIPNRDLNFVKEYLESTIFRFDELYLDGTRIISTCNKYTTSFFPRGNERFITERYFSYSYFNEIGHYHENRNHIVVNFNTPYDKYQVELYFNEYGNLIASFYKGYKNKNGEFEKADLIIDGLVVKPFIPS